MRNLLNRALFRVRWLGMSERSRYALLWSRTRENLEDECFARGQWLQRSYRTE